MADRIVTLLSEPYDIEGRQALIGASAGIALAPDDGMTAEQLLRNADMALNQAKEDGRCTFCFFEPGTSSRVRNHRTLEPDSHNALAADEFVQHEADRTGHRPTAHKRASGPAAASQSDLQGAWTDANRCPNHCGYFTISRQF